MYGHVVIIVNNRAREGEPPYNSADTRRSPLTFLRLRNTLNATLERNFMTNNERVVIDSCGLTRGWRSAPERVYGTSYIILAM